jgi:hypothetical protein
MMVNKKSPDAKGQPLVVAGTIEVSGKLQGIKISQSVKEVSRVCKHKCDHCKQPGRIPLPRELSLSRDGAYVLLERVPECHYRSDADLNETIGKAVNTPSPIEHGSLLLNAIKSCLAEGIIITMPKGEPYDQYRHLIEESGPKKQEVELAIS